MLWWKTVGSSGLTWTVLSAQQEAVPDFSATAPFLGYVEFRRAGKSPRWSVLCGEDEVELDYRRKAREHVL